MFSEGVSLLLLACWTVCIVATVVLHLLLPWRSYLPNSISDALAYGKLTEKIGSDLATARRNSNGSSTVQNLLMNMRFSTLLKSINSIPRRYFTHFYAWGSLWNAILLISLSFYKIGATKWSSVELDVFLTLLLLYIQTFRRLLESMFVTRYSNRQMHIIHYILGLYFYTAVGPTAMISLVNTNDRDHETGYSPSFPITWRHIMTVALFTWASYHQYICHVILANLRHPTTPEGHKKMTDHSRKQLNVTLGIPDGDWFQVVSCPHYFAEILIYCSPLLLEWGVATMMLFPCLFVVCLLTLSARQMHSWYINKFSDYPCNRKRIIPYVF